MFDIFVFVCHKHWLFEHFNLNLLSFLSFTYLDATRKVLQGPKYTLQKLIGEQEKKAYLLKQKGVINGHKILCDLKTILVQLLGNMYFVYAQMLTQMQKK